MQIVCVYVYSNQGNNVKSYKTQRYYLKKGYIKNYNVIINLRNLYDQPTGFDIERYGSIRQVTTGQGEDYITCLLDYDYIKLQTNSSTD